MQTKIRNSFFSAKLKAFLFFLVLATIFWILTRFSKQEAGAVSADLEYVNIPEGQLLLESNPKEIAFTLAANKFEILYYRIRKPNVLIDVASYSTSKKRNILLSQEILKELVQSRINNNLLVQKVLPQELLIELETLNVKEVPIEVISNINYKSGFGASGAALVDPDMVTVIGARQYLDSINVVQTVAIDENNVEKSLNLKVPLKVNDTTRIKINPRTISYKQKVVEFSEKEIELDISVINAPKNTTLRLLPAKVTIVFNVPVASFNAITSSDFEVTVDYKKRNDAESFVIPEITKQPAGIKDVELGVKKVDLLLFK